MGIKVYSPEESMQFCTPCFGGYDLSFKDIKISGVYISEDQALVTKEMALEIIDKINKFFPLHWADVDILCLPFRPMLKKNGSWTGTDYNGQAWKGVIALGAQQDIATHLFTASMILHELWHEFAYRYVDSTPFDREDTPEYKKFKEIMGIQSFNDSDFTWEDRTAEILAELGRYYATDTQFTWDKFITFGDKNDPLPLREAYDFLTSLMPPKPEEAPIMRDINLLHPDLIRKATKLIELAKAKGIDIIISQTFRSKEEQDALYAQGRTAPGNIVTNVKYPISLHCWGIAFDVAVIINKQASWIAAHFDVVGPIGESIGLKWGGRWQNFPDKPHFELPFFNAAELVKAYGVPENFIKTWKNTKEEAGVISLKGEDFDADAKVFFKGKEIQAGIVTLPEGGKTFIEIRAVAELLGLKVSYDNPTKTVTLS